MTLLDPTLSIDLQYLGVRLPIPPPGACLQPLTQELPPSQGERLRPALLRPAASMMDILTSHTQNSVRQSATVRWFQPDGISVHNTTYVYASELSFKGFHRWLEEEFKDFLQSKRSQNSPL